MSHQLSAVSGVILTRASGASELVDLTQHEIEGLKTRHNLADAHTHQLQSPTQRQIIADLPELWYESEQSLQIDREETFLDAFFRLHGQSTARALNKTMLSYSASVSTMIAAMYCAQRKMSVGLVEPCFDNLVDLLKHMGTPLVPLPEEFLWNRSMIVERLAQVDADVLYLVDPNNPTGFSLLKDGRRGFEELVRYCVDHHKLLIIDFCFASFALCDPRHDRFDVYELLESSGVSYMAIEDTGKTWPVQDAKCAMLTVSADLREAVYNIHTAVLLNVSPFVLNFLSRYIEDSIADGFASVRDVISVNRASVRLAVSGTMLELIDPIVDTSVAWCRINDPEVDAETLQQQLLTHEVYVLPGTYFYWNNHTRGSRYIRLALARQPREFRAAMTAMREVLTSNEN